MCFLDLPDLEELDFDFSKWRPEQVFEWPGERLGDFDRDQFYGACKNSTRSFRSQTGKASCMEKV